CRTVVLSTPHGLITASVRGIGQVLFQDSVLSGLIILLGIALNSRISALAAIFGATAGTITVIVLGSTDPALCHGAYGFNAALAAVGFGGLFFVITRRAAVYALLCALTATAGMVWMATLLAPLGLPALSAPFTLTSWLFLLPRSRTRALAPVAFADLTTPEHIRRLYVTPGATRR